MRKSFQFVPQYVGDNMLLMMFYWKELGWTQARFHHRLMSVTSVGVLVRLTSWLSG